jgi:hypothetical protein
MGRSERATRIAGRTLRRVAGEASTAWRRTLRRPGSLPDFVVLGAQKAGTTSLFGYLGQHPQVLRSRVKEVHFFDDGYRRGEVWYRSHFPSAGQGPPGAVVGEASPYYLCHPHAPRRMRERLPRVKLVALLRNPSERAVSHYFHELRKQRETLPILEAMRAEEARIGAEWERLLRDERHVSPVHRAFSYKQRGVYVDQLERWWAQFPRDRLLVLESAELFSAPGETLRRVFAFLGIDPDFRCADLAPRNVGVYREEVPAAVRQELDAFFRPHNRRLFERLGRDLGW